MGVSKNRGGPPKSSILIGISIIFTIHFGGFPTIFGLTPTSSQHNCEAASSDAFPSNLTFSGSSGGALVATVLGTGLQPREIFEMVVKHLGVFRRRGSCSDFFFFGGGCYLDVPLEARINA